MSEELLRLQVKIKIQERIISLLLIQLGEANSYIEELEERVNEGVDTKIL